MRAPGCVTWKGFLSLAGRRGGRAGGTEHPGSRRGREARAALPQPGLGLPGSPCPKPLPPRQPRSSAVSLTVGHRVQGIAPTLPLSFHPGERGAYNPQPPSSPPTSTPHPAWSPQNAALPQCSQLRSLPPAPPQHSGPRASSSQLPQTSAHTAFLPGPPTSSLCRGGEALPPPRSHPCVQPPLPPAAPGLLPITVSPLGYVCHCGPPGVRAQCETSTLGLDRHQYLTVHDIKTPASWRPAGLNPLAAPCRSAPNSSRWPRSPAQTPLHRPAKELVMNLALLGCPQLPVPRVLTLGSCVQPLLA